MGLPLTMAATHLADGELGPFMVVPLLGAVAVLGTYLLGVHLHSRTAGVVAAALVTTSPIFLFQLVQPMSDVPATAWWTLALVLALSPRYGSLASAGAVTGLAVLTRPNLQPLAIPVALVATLGLSGGLTAQNAEQGTPSKRLMAFLAGLVPPAIALLFVQLRLYGAPWTSGYGAFESLFSWANVWPNLQGYAMRLWRGEAASICAALAALAVIAFSRSRHTCSEELRRACAAAGVACALVLLCYLPYGVFAEWFYLRFLLPAFPLIMVLVGALLTCASARLPKPIAGLVLVVVVTAACSANVVRAQREQAFNLRLFEARYRAAGRYLEAMLPSDAVVLAVQESGSVAHYARRPVVRWDALGELDTALETLQKIGLRPVLLVEDWEAADLLARFPKSAVARLNWPARAEFGDETRVRLFDPADLRDELRSQWADRVH
jgi:4-amino-4-deoxy-L-arabinose transferase-like glycosyltransferase